MDLFGKVPLVEIPVKLLPEQKAWLEMMVKKGKIAVPPGGSLPEGSVISIFMRTLLWNSEEQGQSLGMVPAEALQEVLGKNDLIETRMQVSTDQKAWLDKVAASTQATLSPGDSAASIFVRVLLQ